MDILPYRAADRDACLALLDSNTPEFFAPAERATFEAFLESPSGSYFAMEHDGAIVGCGGYAREPEPGVVSLTWGMVRRDLHGHGLGKFLLLYRLREIGKLAGVAHVRLQTTPAVAPFFAKFAFKTGESAGAADADGLVTMWMKPQVCA